MTLRKTNKIRPVIVLSLLAAGLLLVIIFATAFGSASVSISDTFKMMLNKTALFHFPMTWRGAEEDIIFLIRLPRVIGGALVGGALATAGVLFQGLLRNPMADPYIIGTSAGAALGASIAMIIPLNMAFLGFGLVPVFAFIGALGTVIIVYNLARVGGKAPIVSMLLAGFVVSALLSAVIAVLISVSERLSLNLHSVYSFMLGHISVSSWTQLAIIAPLILLGISGARFFALQLNAFSLGEEGASYLGIEVELTKIYILALGSLLTAAAVSISGSIGFVGLVVPHAVRLSLGPEHRALIPVSVLAGAVFLVLADLLARTVLTPAEIPVGVITALVGGPFFLYILRASKREYAF